MKASVRMAARRTRAPRLFLLLAAFAAASSAMAADASGGLRALLQGAQPKSAPATARYTTETGVSFVIDLAAPRPLLKFDDSGEAWVLTPEQGQGGMTLYKNDVGQVMLREPAVGGVTVYTPDNNRGMAAALEGPASRIGMAAPLNKTVFDARMVAASQAIKSSAPQLQGLSWEAEIPVDKLSEWSALLVDTANVLAETVDHLASDSKGRKAIDKIDHIKLTIGDQPTTRLDHGQLLVQVAPKMGLAGRPSSERIEETLGYR